MNNDPLDYLDPVQRKKFSFEAKVIPIILLWIGFILNILVQKEIFIIEGILILLASTLFFIKKVFASIIAAIVCLFGMFGLMNLFPIKIYFGFGSTGVEVISLAVFLITILVNQDIIRNQFFAKSLDDETSSSLSYFKKRFEKRSINELRDIRDDTSRKVEARQAASEILEGKLNEENQ